MMDEIIKMAAFAEEMKGITDYYRQAQEEFDPELLAERAAKLRPVRAFTPILGATPVQEELSTLKDAYHHFMGKK